mmetsp:Transcript_20671/g.60076  ORF Transcript_20671/g.60076 Transcript_20671/m.60076 type:complete len:149 (-) Transcript_20671:1960-2406(-)
MQNLRELQNASKASRQSRREAAVLMSVARPRKPSVAVSRRFSCANSFRVERAKQHAPTDRPKVFLDGRNVTPQPLRNAEDYWSIEDVGYLRPDAPSDGTSVPDGSKLLAWPEFPADGALEDEIEAGEDRSREHTFKLLALVAALGRQT